VSGTPSGKKKEMDAVPSSGKSSNKSKKVSPATTDRDEVSVSMDTTSDTVVDRAAEPGTPTSTSTSSSASSASSSAADEKARPAAQDAPVPASIPPWTVAAEPAGSVFADRIDKPYTDKPFGVREIADNGPKASDMLKESGKAAEGGRSPRKAHLQISRFEPWSVMKFSFMMSLVSFVVLLVAVVVLYVILSGLGVFDAITNTVNQLTQDQGAGKTSTFDAASWFSFSRILGYTVVVGGLNVLLITALATVWSVIYNLAADWVGGVEVTLKEAE
jgi:hypothetical protein